jgi:glycosyltransferase involved in cell wall biosynthesis
MLQNEHIIILGLPRFDGPYESTNITIARELAKENDVYYIDNPLTWKDYWQLKGTDAVNSRKPFFTAHSNGIIQQTGRLRFVVTPPVLSLNFLPEGWLYRKLLAYNEHIIRKRVRNLLKAQHINSFIFINSYNFHFPNMVKGLPAKCSIYHCVDPIIRPYDRKHGLVSEEILIKNSDMVICTSKALQKEKSKHHPRCLFIPNAADIAHSSKAMNPSLPIDPLLEHIKRPIIGYLGNIERRIDYELMRELSAMHPDKQFVFTGPVEKEFVPDWFFHTPNIHLTGRIMYNRLPALLKGFDVAILPFKKDAVSHTIFPLKLFEYLGAGKPTIATDFNPDLAGFTGTTIPYCSDAASFSSALEAALEETNATLIEKRLAVAKENTWEKRATEISNAIAHYLYQQKQ